MNEFNDIRKGESTNIFRKIWKSIKYFFTETFWGWLTSIFGTVFILVVAICSLLIYEDYKQYPEGDYELTYKVYYTPSNAKTYTVKHNRPIMIRSSRGTNSIYLYDKGTIIETSAPIEKVRYVNHIHK